MNNEKPQDSGKIVERNKEGKFIEGHPKLGGKAKGTKNYLTLLEEAIKNYETEKGKNLFKRLIERAFINDTVLLGVIKKFVPDKTSTEIITPEPIEITVIHIGNKIEE